MAYRIVVLIASDRPGECVDPDRVGRLTARFGVREVRAFVPGGSVGFHVPSDQGGDCYVEVDLDAGLIDWYTGKFESEHGRPLDPAPNVFASWTVSGAVDLELMCEVAEVVTPGVVVTARDDVVGFGVEFRP